MFKATHHTEADRTFATYAEAHRFVMKEGAASRLWEIVAANIQSLRACKVEKDRFQGSIRHLAA